MRIGIIGGRFGGIDGVSIETDKWIEVLERLGHKVKICTGEIVAKKGYTQHANVNKYLKEAKIIPEMSFWYKENKKINDKALEKNNKLENKIEKLAGKIKKKLLKWIKKEKIDSLIIENAGSIPWHIPLGVAINRIVIGSNLKIIFHHHDFRWEREKYSKYKGDAKKYIKKHFPYKHKNAEHLVINSITKKELYKRKKINSKIVPNVFKFSVNKKIDDYNSNFRKDFGINKEDIIVLNPVRVEVRKNIEMAIKIVEDLKKIFDKKVFLATGYETPKEKKYWNKLKKMAAKKNVDLIDLWGTISPRRKMKNGKRCYTPWDAFINSDFVLYPSKWEGWGNAFVEALAFKKLVAIRRYPVFKKDIEPSGLETISFDRYSKKIAEKIYNKFNEKKDLKRIVEKNFKIGEKKFSLKSLEKKLKKVLEK